MNNIWQWNVVIQALADFLKQGERTLQATETYIKSRTERGQ